MPDGPPERAQEIPELMAIPKNGLEVPYTRLAADVLRRLAEEYVTRDGTDYGAVEKTLVEKVSALRREEASWRPPSPTRHASR